MPRNRIPFLAAGLACLALVIAPAQDEPASGDDSGVVQIPQPPGSSRVDSGVKPPVPIYRPDPEYSEEARKAKYQGTVILGIVVDEGGVPQDVHVLKPLGMGLDEKAIEAVEKWRFRPGIKDGNPVKVTAKIEVNFRLLIKGWNMGPLRFQTPEGASAAVLQTKHFKDPKPRVPGTVRLAFDIDAQGKPQNVRIVRPGQQALEEAATQSIMKCRFQPAMKDGRAVPSSAKVDLTFTPKG